MSMHLLKFFQPEGANTTVLWSAAHEHTVNVWEHATTAWHGKGMQELHHWLSCLPIIWGMALPTCTPTDVISFMGQNWHAAGMVEHSCSMVQAWLPQVV